MLRIDPIPPGEREKRIKTVREPNIIQYSPCWTAKVAYEKTFAISHTSRPRRASPPRSAVPRARRTTGRSSRQRARPGVAEPVHGHGHVPHREGDVIEHVRPENARFGVRLHQVTQAARFGFVENVGMVQEPSEFTKRQKESVPPSLGAVNSWASLSTTYHGWPCSRKREESISATSSPCPCTSRRWRRRQAVAPYRTDAQIANNRLAVHRVNRNERGKRAQPDVQHCHELLAMHHIERQVDRHRQDRRHPDALVGAGGDGAQQKPMND